MKNEIIKFKIPIQPHIKKNSQQIIWNKKTHKPLIIQNKKYREYESDCKYLIPYKYRLNINYPVNIKCLFYMPTKRKVDLTNLLEAIDDILVKYGVIEDDNSTILVGHDGSRVLYDKIFTRTEIEITKIKEIKNDNH